MLHRAVGELPDPPCRRDGRRLDRPVAFPRRARRQGLLLDAERGAFPHVTPSRTGLAGLLPVLRDAGITRLRVTCATRAYVNRHGAGPLAHELSGPPAAGVVDRTNRPHPFQGSLRFAALDLDILRDAIRDDLGDAPAWLTVEPALAVTCLDQMEAAVSVFVGGVGRKLTREALPQAVAPHCGLPLRAVAAGDRRSAILFHSLPAMAARGVTRRGCCACG